MKQRPGLTRDQLHYAENRLHNLRAEEEKRIRDACAIKDDTPHMTVEEFVKGVKAGRIKAKEVQLPVSITDNMAITYAFDIKLPKRYPDYDQAKYDRLMKESKVKWTSVFDRLYLSNADEVLKLIAEVTP